MTAHDCPGLAVCRDHPRFHIISGRAGGGWWVYWPMTAGKVAFTQRSFFAEAIAYADWMARLEATA